MKVIKLTDKKVSLIKVIKQVISRITKNKCVNAKQKMLKMIFH